MAGLRSLSSSGALLFVFIVIFTVICATVLGLRFWAARISRRSFYPDDAFIGLSFTSTCVLEGVVIWAIVNGCGKQAAELNAYELAVQGKLYFLSGIFWLLGSVFVKLAVLWLYSRIFVTDQFRRWAYGLMGIVVCYGISFLVAYQTNCHPISQLWDPVKGGWCRDVTGEQFGTIGVNLALDIAIVTLPMPTLWSLNMPQRKKLIVTLMFSIGIITIATLGWRLAVTIEASKHPLDFSYYLSTIGLVSLLEVWLSIIVGCLPTLAPVFNLKVKPAISKMRSTGNHSSQGVAGSHQLRSFKQKRPRGLYSELDESRDRDFVALHDHAPGMAITAEITSDPYYGQPKLDEGHRVVHVRRDIESQQWYQGNDLYHPVGR
ncbi:Uu.00g124140.m01.CDS01 [Anthostomella pinea]|uniref:Uu.00g124140.m01.CDS01 n=1 Tax=Anthostomella pinea TaxID=933095 RepID=A0AAI8VIH3_9PEZI|nr:Uu.00g124140.m01.CDS01 [Anthostomella pinea]